MLKRIFVIVVICLTAGSSGLFAQTDSSSGLPAVWDLRACLDYAQKNNITLNSLRLTAGGRQQDLLQSKAARYPDLAGTASQDLMHYNSGLSSNTNVGVSSSVIIYEGGYLHNDVQSKQLSLQAANLDIAAAENDVTLQITEAFLNILLAKENILYYQDLVATTRSQVEQGEQRFKAGTLAQKDLLELEATLSSDRYSLVLAQNTERQNALILKQILQLPTQAPFDVINRDSLNVNPPVAPLDEAEDIALKSRPEVKSGELGVQVQQIELEKVKAGLRPTLSLGGSVATNYSGRGTGTYFPQLNNNFYQELGINLSVPILDRKVTATNVEKARIAIDQAKLSLQDTKTTLAQNIEQAYINVQNARGQYAAAEEQLKYTREAFRIADEQLRIGVYNLVDYLQQKNLYVQAQQSYIQAKYSAALYAKIYNFYTGVPVTE
jgi:outer membrane protein